MKSEIIERADGKLVLPSDGDPAVVRVQGRRQLAVGLDLAMRRDRTAFCAVELVQRPRWVHSQLQELEDPEMTVMAGNFVEAANYHELVQVIMNLMKKPELARSKLVVDIGASGRAWADAFAAHPYYEQLKNLIRVQITAGEKDKNVGAHWNVARNLLLEGTGNAIQNGDLKLADFPMRDALKSELEGFVVKMGSTGRKKIEGGSTKRGASHADLATACALAHWALSNPHIMGNYGPRPLAGMV